MTPLSLAEVARLVGGRLADSDGSPVVSDVVADSRQASSASLFAALPGERTDGHDHAAAAGAGGVLARRPVGVPAVVVDDVAAALGRLAHEVLARLPDVTVVGVTGSAGKTTTKDLLAVLLPRLGPTVAASGSFNNELGLPLTVLRCDASTRFLVLEYGARGSGHIRALTEIACPHVAVVLNVGSAHVGEFGSLAATAAAKGELVEAALRLVVLSADDPNVLPMGARTGVEVTTFGMAGFADLRAEGIRIGPDGRVSFRVRWEGHPDWADGDGEEYVAPVDLRLVGEHQVGNALAAATVALELGLDLAEVAEVLSTTGPASPHRMAVAERADGVIIIDDSYNANPESVRAALKALVSMARAQGRRSVAVLGEMLELGPGSPQQHAELGELAVRLDVGRVVTVGDPATPIGCLHAAAVLEGSWGAEAVHRDTVEEALDFLRGELLAGDVVLVKASRGIGLDRVADALLADVHPAAGPPAADARATS